MAKHGIATKAPKGAIALHIVTPAEFPKWKKGQDATVGRWLKETGFKGKDGNVRMLPGKDGRMAGAVLVTKEPTDPFAYAALPTRLPAGTYRFAKAPKGDVTDAAVLGWALGCYRFEQYKKAKGSLATLVAPDGPGTRRALALADGIGLARDLINTPAEDMGPSELAAAVRSLGKGHGAKVTVTQGKVLEKGFPTIHTVGRAADDGPRLIDLRWGRDKHPKVTLVGKGVCFDSGGLDLKSASNMLLMKKDMGGAATVLGLASAIMALKLPVRLRVLVPAVENSVSDESYRPGDVIRTKKGTTVEVGNTDAEGRLVLCDTLVEACREKPEMIIDMATLTGAARVALGTDLPALFCNDDALAKEILAGSDKAGEPLWRMPLHQPYKKLLDSRIADMNNVSSGGFGGAITAALFLEHFIDKGIPWAHIDTMAWNTSSKPGRPAGGEAMGLRALWTALETRYGT